MKEHSVISKRSLHHAYDQGKRNLLWADSYIRRFDKLFSATAPLIGALAPESIPALAATKAGLISYGHARDIARSGDQIKSAMT